MKNSNNKANILQNSEDSLVVRKLRQIEEQTKDMTREEKDEYYRKMKEKIVQRELEYFYNIDNYETVKCPNCGALAEVKEKGKVKCLYCRTILSGSKR